VFAQVSDGLEVFAAAARLTIGSQRATSDAKESLTKHRPEEAKTGLSLEAMSSRSVGNKPAWSFSVDAADS
jgi:hypothetical protein